MTTVQLELKVGADGVLTLRVPLGADEAKHRVSVTIQPLPPESPADAGGRRTPDDWHAFVEQTYGSCAGLGLEPADQGDVEEREPIE